MNVGRLLRSIASVILGLSLGLLVTKIAGENPWNVLRILVRSAFGSPYDLGMTLFYATPLIFTGLSVAVAFRAGLFNIGAEGQLNFGALAASVAGIYFPKIPYPVAPIFSAFCAFSMGAFWGAIPGWLRAKRESHEVINTIMLNFISAGICSWLTIYIFRNSETQNPETQAVAPGYLIPGFSFFGGAPVSFALILALISALFVWYFLKNTTLGYELRAVGQNEAAAKAAGIDASKIRILAMTLSGGLAGLVGVSEVLGNAGAYKLGFSPGYGFMGIAVALLGRNRAFGVVCSAFLFGALYKGTTDLDLETENVTRDISLVLQALVILCVSAEGFWSFMGDRLKQKFARRKKPSVESQVV